MNGKNQLRKISKIIGWIGTYEIQPNTLDRNLLARIQAFKKENYMDVFTTRDRALKILLDGMYTTISESKHRDNFIYKGFSGCLFDIARCDMSETDWEFVKPYIKREDITETHLIGAMMASDKFINVTETGCSIR